MNSSFGLRSKVATYIRTHPREMRFLAFLAALCLVWMAAPAIESFIQGFFEGWEASRAE